MHHLLTQFTNYSIIRMWVFFWEFSGFWSIFSGLCNKQLSNNGNCSMNNWFLRNTENWSIFRISWFFRRNFKNGKTVIIFRNFIKWTFLNNFPQVFEELQQTKNYSKNCYTDFRKIHKTVLQRNIQYSLRLL